MHIRYVCGNLTENDNITMWHVSFVKYLMSCFGPGTEFKQISMVRWIFLIIQSILVALHIMSLFANPLEDLRRVVWYDDVGSCTPHTREDLHQGRLEVKCSSLGSVVQHGILPRHLVDGQRVGRILKQTQFQLHASENWIPPPMFLCFLLNCTAWFSPPMASDHRIITRDSWASLVI